MKKNVKLERLVTKLNRATKLLAETASALTVEVESRHRVIDMLSSVPAAKAPAKSRVKAKAQVKVKSKTKSKTRSKTKSSTTRRGRPAGTGRFETRADLEAFVHGRRRTGAFMSAIADEAGVSIPVVVRILQSKEPKASRRATRRAPRPADLVQENHQVVNGAAEPTPVVHAEEAAA